MRSLTCYYKVGRKPRFPPRRYKRRLHVDPRGLDYRTMLTLKTLGTGIWEWDREVRLVQAIRALEVHLTTDRAMADHPIVVINHARIPPTQVDITDRGVNPLSTSAYPETPLQPTRCSRCGRTPHLHPEYCRAINLSCWTCHKRGHVSGTM